jgi:DNA-binding CsgD family transcriptional regulator
MLANWFDEYELSQALSSESLALSLAEKAFVLCGEVDFKQMTAYALGLLGLLDLQRGEETLAHSHLEEALRLQTELWHQYGIAWAMYDLAGLHLAQRDYASARTAYEEGFQRAMAVGDQMLVACCLEGLAAAVVAQARAWVHEQTFRTSWDEGGSMTPAQALATRPAEGELSVQVSSPSPPAASSNHPARHPEGLTPREVEVLRLLAQGMTSQQIAERLILSLHTVNAHVRSIYTKLELNSRSALTRYAIEQHLL